MSRGRIRSLNLMLSLLLRERTKYSKKARSQTVEQMTTVVRHKGRGKRKRIFNITILQHLYGCLYHGFIGYYKWTTTRKSNCFLSVILCISLLTLLNMINAPVEPWSEWRGVGVNGCLKIFFMQTFNFNQQVQSNQWGFSNNKKWQTTSSTCLENSGLNNT